MGIMSGLLISNEKFDISVEVDRSKWKYLLAIDLHYLNFLKDARFTRSNDLLYAYCTEYNLQDIVGHMHPNSSTFSAFKLRMAPYMQKFYSECVIQRLSEMFGFYKGSLMSIMESQTSCFYGSKIMEDSLSALAKATVSDDIYNKVDDVYLTLKNYLKFQINQTTEMLSNEVVKAFISKLETVILTKNEGVDDDQLRRKYCRVIEIANLFLSYTKSYTDCIDANRKRMWSFNNQALINFDAIWKSANADAQLTAILQKGLPYRHIDIDAAVCIFPETTEYPLLKEEFTKQNRPSNPTSEHLINDWMLHWAFVSALIKRREAEKKLELKDVSATY